MKILVVGAGWTGKKVYNELLARKKLQVAIASHTHAQDVIHNYDYVINCAGVTGSPNVDACELDKKGTIEGNAVYPILLQKLCQEHNIKFAHFSSGCIYTGEINDVNAEPNFFGSIYSVSKGISDSYLKDKALVFRIRMPFTSIDEPKNYLTKVRNYANIAKLYDSGKNSLSDHNEAIKVACDLVLDGATCGAYNLVNKGSVTMRELAQLMKLDAEWYSTEEFCNVTKAGRSTCTIPAFDAMSSIDDALAKALKL